MPQTIALVDDDRNILTSVSIALQNEGFTVRMYADRKGWDLKNITADLQMERTVENGVQHTSIIQYLKFDGDLSLEQKERLLYISGKCPVHKTLSLSMQIDNRLI